MYKIPKTVLVVVAHPDDAEVIAGSTIAKWTDAGSNVSLLVCTDGSKGADDTSDPKLVKAERAQEQARAAKVLGISNVTSLSEVDCELTCDMHLKEKIVSQIRKVKPELVITFDPSFIYSVADNTVNHQDHRAVGQATIDSVFPLARDPLSFADQQLGPHKVKTLLLFNPDTANYYVDSSSFFETQLDAIFEHESQFPDRAGFTKFLRSRQVRIAKDTDYDQCEGFVRLDLT